MLVGPAAKIVAICRRCCCAQRMPKAMVRASATRPRTSLGGGRWRTIAVATTCFATVRSCACCRGRSSVMRGGGPTRSDPDRWAGEPHAERAQVLVFPVRRGHAHVHRQFSALAATGPSLPPRAAWPVGLPAVGPRRDAALVGDVRERLGEEFQWDGGIAPRPRALRLVGPVRH